MKYEIRIISEEDTIKSRTYEDFGEAIEIAEIMLNDFVNTDFGDEIIITEENNYKPSKYLWANGKILIEELKVGDIVKIIDKGKTYTNYTEFMTQYATPTQCCVWDYNVVPNADETQYVIRGIALHERQYEGKLAIIQEHYRGELGKIYLMNVKGLRKI
jgi:hypothetical protein